MKVIKAKFERLSDVTLDRLPGAVGVYVLWSGKSRVRPKYIGEGVILKRFAEHVGNMSLPLKGVISILGYTSQKEIKTNAEIVEALLLYISYEVNRFPTTNRNIGKHSRIDKVFKRHGVLRIRVIGYDPLRNPKSPMMNKEKFITLRANKYNEIELKYPWKLRSKTR